MKENDKPMTQEEADEDFRNAVADIFSEKVPGVHRDKDGFIVIPRVTRRKSDSNQE